MFEGGALRGGERCHVAVEVAEKVPFAVAAHAVAQDQVVHAPA